MQDLEITWPEGKTRFSVADSPIHLGRSSEAAVPLTEGSVSRKHLMLVWDGASWSANDSSTHGTFDPTGVRLPAVWSLSGERTIRLGGVEGVPVQIRPATAASRPAPASSMAGAASQPHPNPVASPPPAAKAPTPPPLDTPPSQAQADPEPVLAGLDDGAASPAPASNGAVLEGDKRALAEAGANGLGLSEPSTPDALANPQPDVRPDARSTPGFGGLFSDPQDAPRPDEPMLRFTEDSLFPNRAEQPQSPPPGPPPAAGQSPIVPDAEAPSLLESDTVSAFSDPVPSLTPPDLSQPDLAPPDHSPLQGGHVAPPVDVSAATPPGPRFDATPQVPGQGPAGGSDATPGILRPGLTGANPAIDPNSTLISDATLRVSVGGQDYSFLPGADVTIGRDPSCLIQLDERHSLVSRKHLRVTFEDGDWWLEDFSSKGTFVNGKRLKKPYKAEGAFVANLGDDDAGTPLRIITAGEHRVPRDKTALIIVGLAIAALVPLVVLALLLTGNNSTTVEPDLATAKKSTVMLFGLDGGQGSGFFVSDNLILTNQHVSVLSPQLLVGVSREADQPAEIEYATELVANHPFLDLSVLRVSNRVTRTSEGTEISAEPVGDIDLPAVTLGDSADVTIGDRVFNTGFPGRLSITSLDDAGELRLPSVVATSGEAANFAFWPGCSNSDADLYIPADSPPGVRCSESGDLDAGVLLSSFFSSGQGASGSAVYHNNEVVAVVYAGADGEDNANLGITTAIFSDWLQEIIAQNP